MSLIIILIPFHKKKHVRGYLVKEDGVPYHTWVQVSENRRGLSKGMRQTLTEHNCTKHSNEPTTVVLV